MHLVLLHHDSLLLFHPFHALTKNLSKPPETQLSTSDKSEKWRNMADLYERQVSNTSVMPWELSVVKWGDESTTRVHHLKISSDTFLRERCNASTRCSNWRLQSMGHVVFGTTAHSEGHSRRLLAVLRNSLDLTKQISNPRWLAQCLRFPNPPVTVELTESRVPLSASYSAQKNQGHQEVEKSSNMKSTFPYFFSTSFDSLGLHSRWHWWSWWGLRNLIGQMSFLFHKGVLLGVGHEWHQIIPMAHHSPAGSFNPVSKLPIPLWIKGLHAMEPYFIVINYDKPGVLGLEHLTCRHLRHRDACPSRI